MKRVLLLLLMLVSGYQFVYSQIQISLVDIIENNGVMFNQHTDKHFSWWIDKNSSYVVVPIKGLTQKDIYQKLLLALNDCYMNIKQVATGIEYEAITINAYHNSNRSLYLWNNQHVVLDGFKYRLSFKMKDGKLRLDTPSIIMCDYHYTKRVKQKVIVLE